MSLSQLIDPVIPPVRQRPPKEANRIRSTEQGEVVYELSSKKMVKIGLWED